MHDTYWPPYIWMLLWENLICSSPIDPIIMTGPKKDAEMAVYMLVSRSPEASAAFIECSSVKLNY